MTEPSGTVAVCSGDACDYETVVYPVSEKQKHQWACGYKLPELICPECRGPFASSILEVVG